MNDSPQIPKLLSAKEVATQLGVSRSLVYEWVSEGLLTHWRFGKRKGIRIHPKDLEAFLLRQQQKEIPDASLRHLQ